MEVVVQNGTISREEEQYCIQYISQKYPHLTIHRLFLTLEGECIRFAIEPQKGTLAKMGGTLISDPLTWNDAKRAEYFDTLPNPIL